MELSPVTSAATAQTTAPVLSSLASSQLLTKLFSPFIPPLPLFPLSRRSIFIASGMAIVAVYTIYTLWQKYYGDNRRPPTQSPEHKNTLPKIPVVITVRTNGPPYVIPHIPHIATLLSNQKRSMGLLKQGLVVGQAPLSPVVHVVRKDSVTHSGSSAKLGKSPTLPHEPPNDVPALEKNAEDSVPVAPPSSPTPPHRKSRLPTHQNRTFNITCTRHRH